MNLVPNLENAAFYPELLKKVIDNYIPAPLLKNAEQAKLCLNSLQPCGFNLIQVLQSFLDESDNQLKMYGTADDLLANLKIYHNFSLKHRKFGIAGHTPDASVNSQKEPVKYKSVRGNLYYNKHEFIHHLFAQIHSKYLVTISEPSPEVLECMKRNERKLDGCYEFFRYDQVTIAEMREMVVKIHNNLHDQGVRRADQTGVTPQLQNVFDQIRQNLSSVNPAPSGEKKSDAEMLQKIIDSYPRKFLPNTELSRSGTPVVVRIFEDAGQKFVMISEVFKDNRIEKSDESFQKLKDKDGLLWAIDANEVFKTLPDKVGTIEFISVPIQRAKHAAVPIVTPTGDHCILASDAVYELLRRLISALRVFQNFNRDKWQIVHQYIDLLNAVIPLNATNKFFINTVKLEKFKNETDDYWTKFQTGSLMKLVRDVGIYGFDVEFLKEELKILELLPTFPDIMDKAEIAYEYVFKMRKGPTLETSDLIDAVEVCQLIRLLEKCPKLRDFFHNQKYCNLIPGVQCDQCPSPPPRYPTLIPWNNTSDLKEIRLENVITRFPRSGINSTEIDWCLDLPNNKTVTTNFKFLSSDQISKNSPKFFLVDLDDLRKIKTERFEEFMLSEESFLKCHPNKNMYIRTVPIALALYVFTDDVLDIIPVLLKQQNIPTKVINERLKKYRRVWKREEEHIYKLIALEEFKSIIKELKVNEQLITIVPDMVYDRTIVQMNDASATDCIEVFSPDGKRVMDSYQAIFFIFQTTVCGINWKLECCKTHPECRENYKKRVINVMRKYAEMKEATFVLSDHVMKNMTILQNHCTYKQQMQLGLPAYLLYEYPPTQLINVPFYYSIVDAYGLPKRTFNSKEQNSTTPLWTYRAIYIAGWVEAVFNEPELNNLSLIIRHTALNVFPDDIVRKEENLLKSILNITFKSPGKLINQNKPVPKISKNCEEPKTSNTAKKVLEITDLGKRKGGMVTPKPVENQKVQEIPNSSVIEKSSVETTHQDETETEKILELIQLYDKNENDLKRKLAETEKQLEATEKKKVLEIKKLTEKYEKTTSKCENFELRMKELEEEKAAEIQEKTEKYEQKVKKYDELEKKMKEMEREIKENEMKRKESEARKEKELDELKKATAKSDEGKDKRIRILCKNALDSTKEINKLKSTITTLKAEKGKMKEKNNDQIIQKLAQKTKDLEAMKKEISEKNRIIEELKKTSRKVDSEKEKSSKEIQDTISTQIQMLQNLLGNQTSSGAQGKSDSSDTQLRNLQRIKEWMSDKKEIEMAKELVTRLFSLSNRPDIHLFGKYELQQYEKKIQNYLQAVETNIQKLKESAAVSDLPPLPEYPQLSDKFVSELWSEVDKARDHEVKDSECYICFMQMKSEEKTLQCKKCKKTTHLECASRWLKTKQTCGHCREKQLDPNEYPDLSNNSSS